MKRGKNIFWGIVLILCAVFIVVNKLGYFEGIGIFTLLFTVAVAAGLIDSVARRSFGGILFCLAFLGILYDKQLGIEALTPWPILGVALLGTIGLDMIFKPKKKSCKYEKDFEWNDESYREIIDEESDEWVRCEVSFSSTTKYINSTNFKKADLECSFGSLSVYFDNAILAGGKAAVNLEVSFGDMKLYIPKSWKVVMNLDNAFGGCKEYGTCSASDENTLMINGEVAFGGLAIYYI